MTSQLVTYIKKLIKVNTTIAELVIKNGRPPTDEEMEEAGYDETTLLEIADHVDHICKTQTIFTAEETTVCEELKQSNANIKGILEEYLIEKKLPFNQENLGKHLDTRFSIEIPRSPDSSALCGVASVSNRKLTITPAEGYEYAAVVRVFISYIILILEIVGDAPKDKEFEPFIFKCVVAALCLNPLIEELPEINKYTVFSLNINIIGLKKKL